MTEAVAAELGISAGIFGTGAASRVETLGVGLVVVVVDALLGWLMRAFGHDPEKEVTRQAVNLVERLAELMIDGDPVVRQTHDSLVKTASESWFPQREMPPGMRPRTLRKRPIGPAAGAGRAGPAASMYSPRRYGSSGASTNGTVVRSVAHPARW